MISFSEPTQTEVNHRIEAAWAAFAANRQELTSKHYPLKHRLQLFQGTVTPTVLYGSAAWAMTEPLRQQLRTTQKVNASHDRANAAEANETGAK
eukprot:6823815-Pyramimonas_sp.AAC.2